jgi:hypothetical protein
MTAGSAPNTGVAVRVHPTTTAMSIAVAGRIGSTPERNIGILTTMTRPPSREPAQPFHRQLDLLTRGEADWWRDMPERAAEVRVLDEARREGFHHLGQPVLLD